MERGPVAAPFPAQPDPPSLLGTYGLEALAVLSELHNQQLAELSATVMRYRELLEEAGVEPPGDAGADALKQFRRFQWLAAQVWALIDGKVSAEEVRAEVVRWDFEGPRVFGT